MSAQPIPIGIAIVEHDGHFLVGLRSSESSLPGLAEFPGGKCQAGESFADCACRECVEETGLEVRAVQELDSLTFGYLHATVELHFWHCRPVNSDEVAEAHQNFRWVSREELSSLNFPEANDRILQILCGPKS